MKIDNKEFKTKNGNIINYYEIDNEKPPLLIIHAQGTNANSYEKVISKLSSSNFLSVHSSNFSYSSLSIKSSL